MCPFTLGRTPVSGPRSILNIWSHILSGGTECLVPCPFWGVSQSLVLCPFKGYPSQDRSTPLTETGGHPSSWHWGTLSGLEWVRPYIGVGYLLAGTGLPIPTLGTRVPTSKDSTSHGWGMLRSVHLLRLKFPYLETSYKK